MHTNPFSGLDLVVALDIANREAHLTGAVEGCTACTTVSSPHTACPAGRAVEIIRAAAAQAADARARALTATEIVEQLGAL
ncbi:hypothetical protein OH799_34585 [Nocardia sp. NBC_00881]|uniref:hypothetical protein n=1 Tax=Nocardia sp. NBC_00881 TaxID=2975995 RepID=UPI00386E632D|nr:hypothetical protein OH799_34585 [Nocardia sp. NBC_00881]